MHVKCDLVQGINAWGMSLCHYLGIFCPLHPSFSVWPNCCFALEGVGKGWDIPTRQFPKISSGLGFSPHSWRNSKIANVGRGSRFVMFSLTWSLGREWAIKPEMSENSPAQPKAGTWWLLSSVPRAGGDFRAGKPQQSCSSGILSLFSLAINIPWMRIPAFLCWDSSWSHVSFRNHRVTGRGKTQFFNYTAALKWGWAGPEILFCPQKCEIISGILKQPEASEGSQTKGTGGPHELT